MADTWGDTGRSYLGERSDTRNFSNIRSDTPYYRSIPRGLANIGRSMSDMASGRTPSSFGGARDMMRRRAMRAEDRRSYRNGSR